MVKRSKALRRRVEKKVAVFLNKVLTPVAATYRRSRKLVRSFKKKAPLIYNEVESIAKSHLVLLGKKKPSNVRVGDLITSSIIKKLPNINEEKLKEIVSDKKSKSFLDVLAKSFGAATTAEKDYTVLGKEKLFKKILIANRGEIALRIIRACRELGVGVEIVYATADRASLAVKFADKAYCIGSSVGYLNIKKIVEIAKKAKADAIHPGYGFLAENADFARLCEKNKIEFIGPSSKTIKMLGNKVQAREKMAKHGVPVLPGSGILKNKKQAIKITNKIGYPVILKAVGGGGGKGMRIVNNDEELEKFFEEAQSEAQAAFGNKDLYVEKYLEGTKHIEFQVLADKYGNIVHLGERDCTIQRRHQKLIEEAPSIALSDELREEVGEAAVRAVSAVKYRGAGTVEFLLDKDNNYFFIEMNTRIQVEHGITEMVTGVDLVKEQIKLAAGAKLAFKQDDIKINGYAIECRINAEDPAGDFIPSAGTISNYLPPGGPGIRVSSVCHSGYKVEPHFDSLLALLICSGKTRQEAIGRMKGALKEYIIEGVKTTIPFHKAVLEDKSFIRGNITTSFIEKSNILEKLKKEKKASTELRNSQRVLIVTTAVSKYLEKRQKAFASKPNQWVMAGRQELMNKDKGMF
jgi:acetyl-CoA carboxylase biotin carboxylase subunit